MTFYHLVWSEFLISTNASHNVEHPNVKVPKKPAAAAKFATRPVRRVAARRDLPPRPLVRRRLLRVAASRRLRKATSSALQ